MNKRYQEFLREVAEESALKLDTQTGVIFGSRGGYTVCVAPVNQSAAMTVTVSVSQNGAPPVAGELQRFAKATGSLVNCRVMRYKATFAVRRGSQKTCPQRVNEALTMLTEFLRENGYVNCCENCGQETETGAFTVRGVAALLCEECFAQKSAALDASAQVDSRKRENVVGGIVGALLGSLLGVIAIVLLERLGYIAALSGVAMAVCTVKGYEMLGGRLSNKGIVISAVVMLVMVYVGDRIDWAWTAASYFDVDIFTAFRAIPYLLREGFIESGSYATNLIMVYAFTLLGAVPSIISAVRNRDRSTVTGRLHADYMKGVEIE